jgi:uroporphyrinogen decarboxylase
MITGMDRLAAALAGTPSDRIPVFCNLLDQGAKELGMPIEEFYAKGEHVAEAQLRMREKYGHDNVWSLFYVGKEAELLGCRKIKFVKDGPPNVEDFVIGKPGDVAALRVPEDITAHPAFEEELKCLRILRREAGGKYPICAYITATMTLPALLMGMDKWMELLFLGPAAPRDELLEKCHDFFVKEVKAFRDNGADVIVYANPFGSTDIVPMKYFRERSLPWIEKDIKAVGTRGIVYYCGMARLNKVIDLVLERTGIGVYYVSPLDDLSEAGKIIAGRALCCGVINDIKLVDWSKAEIEQEVRRLIDAGKPGGKFLFGTGVMPYGIPEANIRTMLEAAYAYGKW